MANCAMPAPSEVEVARIVWDMGDASVRQVSTPCPASEVSTSRPCRLTSAGLRPRVICVRVARRPHAGLQSANSAPA